MGKSICELSELDYIQRRKSYANPNMELVIDSVNLASTHGDNIDAKD